MNDYIEDSKFAVPLLSERKLSEINAYDYAKSYDGESFAQVLSRYYKELRKIGLTELKLAEITGIQKSSISYYLQGKRNPTLYSLIAICIGMRLYYPRSLLLLKKAKLSIDDDSLKDRICRKYLIGCAFDISLDVDSCNRELRENGQSCLTPSAFNHKDTV